jgi:hypothetical protein
VVPSSPQPTTLPSWLRRVVNDPQGNANLEGIGFLDSSLGWVGGSGDQLFIAAFTSRTVDGGSTWTSANHVGRFLNRFRFVRGPELVGYACGDTSISIQRHPPLTQRSKGPSSIAREIRYRGVPCRSAFRCRPLGWAQRAKSTSGTGSAAIWPH